MGKNIVICCDGTGNEYCHKKTNVAKLFDVIERDPEKGQIAYYDPGVGTIGWVQSITWAGKKLSRLMGLAFAVGLTQNIEEAYKFLMDNYEKGDCVYLFGFSRGTYTVRALAGMIMKCGLLYPERENLISHATKLYRNRKLKPKSEDVRNFRDVFTQECIPHFIGVWDTVKSVGLFNRVRFTDQKLSPKILYGFHALSIDEIRYKFRPVLWEKQEECQIIKQVWFPGVHSDVGGSYEEAGLSAIALRWMLNAAEARGLKKRPEPKCFIVPDCRSSQHNSFTLGWWILGWRHRNILYAAKPRKKRSIWYKIFVSWMEWLFTGWLVDKEGAEGAVVHKCVKEKMKLDPKYTPKWFMKILDEEAERIKDAEAKVQKDTDEKTKAEEIEKAKMIVWDDMGFECVCASRKPPKPECPEESPDDR